MNFEQAMDAARKGAKVTTHNRRHDFYVYCEIENGFPGALRISTSDSIFGRDDQVYYPTTYHTLGNWVVYNKEKPVNRLLKSIKRALSGSAVVVPLSNPA